MAEQLIFTLLGQPIRKIPRRSNQTISPYWVCTGCIGNIYDGLCRELPPCAAGIINHNLESIIWVPENPDEFALIYLLTKGAENE